MLVLDHPQTPHVFAASAQLDLIFDYLKRISYADSKRRLHLLEIIRPCFAALRWLQAQRFADQPHIAAGIDELVCRQLQLRGVLGVELPERSALQPH